MGGRVKLGFAVLTLGALGGGAASVSLAGDGGTARTTSTAQFVRQSIGGTVQAVQAGSARRAGIYVSLHGLEPGTRYRIVQSSATCADEDGDVDGSDFLVWQRFFEAPRARDDAFRASRVRLRKPLSEAKSVRIFNVSDRQRPSEEACSLIDVWEHA